MHQLYVSITKKKSAPITITKIRSDNNLRSGVILKTTELSNNVCSIARANVIYRCTLDIHLPGLTLFNSSIFFKYILIKKMKLLHNMCLSKHYLMCKPTHNVFHGKHCVESSIICSITTYTCARTLELMHPDVKRCVSYPMFGL